MKTTLYYANGLRVPTSGLSESAALDRLAQIRHAEHVGGFDRGGQAKIPHASVAEQVAALASVSAEANG